MIEEKAWHICGYLEVGIGFLGVRYCESEGGVDIECG